LTNTLPSWTGLGVFIKDAQDTYALAVHQDWRGLVTASNPAQASEIVHLYGFNFGPVVSHAPTGVPAGANPLPSTVRPIACSVYLEDNSAMAVPVLYSGLAPGLIGYDQLDVQLPASNLSSETYLFCSGSGEDANFNGYIYVQP